MTKGPLSEEKPGWSAGPSTVETRAHQGQPQELRALPVSWGHGDSGKEDRGKEVLRARTPDREKSGPGFCPWAFLWIHQPAGEGPPGLCFREHPGPF